MNTRIALLGNTVPIDFAGAYIPQGIPTRWSDIAILYSVNFTRQALLMITGFAQRTKAIQRRTCPTHNQYAGGARHSLVDSIALLPIAGGVGPIIGKIVAELQWPALLRAEAVTRPGTAKERAITYLAPDLQ